MKRVTSLQLTAYNFCLTTHSRYEYDLFIKDKNSCDMDRGKDKKSRSTPEK